MITRKDIAQRAGVSTAMVSRVINNSGYVRADKRELIEKLIKEMGYRPNPLAVAMRVQRTKQILFNVSGLNDHYALELYYGAFDYAKEHGYLAVLSKAFSREERDSMMIDGVIIPNEVAVNDLLQSYHYLLPVPIVYAGFGASVFVPKKIPAIEVDTYQAMQMLIEYLRKHGHRKIALATPFELSESNPRCLAWQNQLLPIFGERINDYLLLIPSENRFDLETQDNFIYYGRMLARQFCERNCDATAVACFNDAVAVGFLQYMLEVGKRIPDDLSIMGIDASVLSKITNPVLTTVSLSPYIHGQECARILIDIIEQKKVRRKTNIPISIVKGASVKLI